MATFGTVTPSDTTVIAPALIAIWVGAAGNLAMRAKGDPDSAKVTVAVGTGLLNFPYPVDKVFATGTTASGITGVFAAS